MAEAAPKSVGISPEDAQHGELIFDKFRRWGYLAARLDPLGFFAPAFPADLDDATPTSSEARSIYCGAIGAEFMHIDDPERRAWIARQMEDPSAAKSDQQRILERQHILERLI